MVDIASSIIEKTVPTMVAGAVVVKSADALFGKQKRKKGKKKQKGLLF
jgi:hypothetical protein